MCVLYDFHKKKTDSELHIVFLRGNSFSSSFLVFRHRLLLMLYTFEFSSTPKKRVEIKTFSG